MYSIFSLRQSPEPNKSLLSALKPVGKRQIVWLGAEGLIGILISGLGIYILIHHGMDVSHIGTLGNKIGSAIKGVKNLRALQPRQSVEPKEEPKPEESDSMNSENLEPEEASEGPKSEVSDSTNTEDPSVTETKPVSTQPTEPAEAKKTEEEIKKEKIEIINKTKEELEAQKKALLSEKEEKETKIEEENKSITEIQKLIEDTETEIEKLQNEGNQTVFLNARVIDNKDTDPEITKNRRAEHLKKHLEELDTKIANRKKNIKLSKDYINGKEAEIKTLTTKIAIKKQELASLDEELKKLNS